MMETDGEFCNDADVIDDDDAVKKLSSKISQEPNLFCRQ
jgi:hypothetical protein